MANCGCKPCSKPLPSKIRKCKPFSLCVGNKSLVFNGECLSVVDRKYQIPDGTYTSITFEGGCITRVGQAPIPEYTPQACCDSDTTTKPDTTGGSVTIGKGKNNLVMMNGNAIFVEPNWGNAKTISIAGNGTADKPWKPEVKISKQKGNRLEEKNDGLYAAISFATSPNVTISGTGTDTNPYKFTIEGADAKLPKINKEESEGNGFTIDEYGRFKTDGEISLVTNLEFSSSAFNVMDAGTKTQVIVDEQKLRTGSSLQVEAPLKGKGIPGDVLKIEWTEATLMTMLDEIGKSEALKQKLKTMLGV